MFYYCENCDRDRNDSGPYEMWNGDYICQDCMERQVAREEAMREYEKER